MHDQPCGPAPLIAVGARRGRGWTPVTRGRHRLTDTEDARLADLVAWQSVLPRSGVLTHLTAAEAWGWWMPELPPGLPIFAAVAERARHPQRRGLKVMRWVHTPEARWHGPLRLASPAETLLACAGRVGLLDLVVMTDSAVRLGHTTEEELRVAASRHRRGAPLLRRAIGFVDPRSESPYESLLRVLHTTLGVAVEPQHELHHHGVFVARGDLRVVGTDRFHEYDGAGHRTAEQLVRDLRRDRHLNNAGWTRRAYTRLELLHQPHVIARDCEQALERAIPVVRLRRWRQALGQSCFTPAGHACLRQRLRLA